MIVPLAGQAVAFWLLAPIMVLAAIGMVMARKPVHSALCLATVMISLAVQYAAQEAPFLFAVQIIVYTGAVLMLFLFVVMLVGVDATDSLVETLRGQRVAAIVAAVAFGAMIIGAVGNALVDPANVGLGGVHEAAGGNVPALAYLIFSRWIFIFEATAALLITAVIGAMVLAHRERTKQRHTQRSLSLDRMQRYANEGKHPGAEPTPGVYAQHNAVDTPALLPDGTAAEESVTRSLAARGNVVDAQRLARRTRRTLEAMDRDTTGLDERRVLGSSDDEADPGLDAGSGDSSRDVLGPDQEDNK